MNHVFINIIIMYSTLHYQCCSTLVRDSDKSAAEYRVRDSGLGQIRRGVSSPGLGLGQIRRGVSWLSERIRETDRIGPLARRVGPLRRWTADPPWLISMSYE